MACCRRASLSQALAVCSSKDLVSTSSAGRAFRAGVCLGLRDIDTVGSTDCEVHKMRDVGAGATGRRILGPRIEAKTSRRNK